ncbi:MAG TPA: DNA-binding protein [Nitrospinaceae bacterium]|nr:DNA-binding protein [Nitrospinaceae bacterium]
MKNYTNQNRPSKECWLTESEVSELIGVTRATLQNWRWRGVGLPYSKFLRSVRYKESDLYAYMEAGRIEPEAV